MVRTVSACTRVAAACLLVMVPSALGATWTHVGTSGFSIPGTGCDGENAAECYMTDANRIKISDMVVDAAGNVFSIFNNGDNTGTSNGGITIFKADGSVVNVNVAASHPGAFTKLMIAGDGKVYALQNWVEINWPGISRPWDHKILRVSASGALELILNATTWGGEQRLGPGQPGSRDLDMISDATVGEGGHVYFIMRPAKNTYWDFHMLWRYNVLTNKIEPSMHDGTSNAWGDTLSAFYSLEYVGNGWFALMTKGTFHVDAISWTSPRRIPRNNQGSSWAGDRSTVLAYDPVNVKLWRLGRSDTSTTNIAWRLNGNPANGGLFTTYDEAADRVLGLEPNNANAWHLNRNDPAGGILNGGKYWAQAFAINPADGKAWFALGGDKYLGASINYKGNIGSPVPPTEWSYVGMVYTADTDAGVTYASEGAPLANAQGKPTGYVIALAFGKQNGQCHAFALTLDHANAPQVKLYRSQPLDCPATGACCQRQNNCVDASQTECFTLGYYQGNQTTCASTTCNVTGACCQRHGCSQETGFDCDDIPNSRWEGTGTVCADFDCPKRICQDPVADADGDGDVDQVDFGVFQSCITIAGVISDDPVRCSCYDVAGSVDGGPDGRIDSSDFGPFVNCGSGAEIPVDPACDNPAQ